MMSLHILFITLVLISCGNSVPMRKHQLTKAEIEYKTSTKTLEEMLAKLMNTDDLASTNQDTNCISRTYFGPSETITATLTLPQLNDLLVSLTANTSMVYIITDDRNIYVGSRSDESTMYDDLRSDYTLQLIPSPANIWINKAPCATCANQLYETFKDRSWAHPVINVETFNYNEVNYEHLMGGIGCLAKLQGSGFIIKAWDWNTFSSSFLSLTECTNAVSTQTTSSNYIKTKAHFEKFMAFFSALASGHTIGEWCV